MVLLYFIRERREMMLKELKQVIDYIESHLTEKLSLEEISKATGVSDYHFRKVFYYLSGISLSEYVKKRKLSEANKDLLNGNSVTDVAFKYGYQSIDGFTRAFKSWSGFLPSEVTKAETNKSFPKLSFYIDVKGGESMDYKIVEMPAFKFVGVSKRVPMQFEGENNAIVELAQSIMQEQRDEMHKLMNMSPKEIVNVSYEHEHNFMKDDGELTHLIGVLTTKENVSDLLDTIEVSAYTWAVFPNEGPFPETLQKTYAQTYSEWLPVSDYEVIQAPEFSFTNISKEKENYAYSEVWMPVLKK
jgi:AraC family transcriptional regulator